MTVKHHYIHWYVLGYDRHSVAALRNCNISEVIQAWKMGGGRLMELSSIAMIDNYFQNWNAYDTGNKLVHTYSGMKW